MMFLRAKMIGIYLRSNGWREFILKYPNIPQDKEKN